MVLAMISLVNIPAKSTFKQNEVCQITGVKPYVLKFWEEQFDEINPIVSATGKKLYEHSDIQSIAMVKKLLFDEKLTVDQAKLEIKSRMQMIEAKDCEDCENYEDAASGQHEDPQVVAEAEAYVELSEKNLSISSEAEQVSREIALDKQVEADLEEFEQSLEQDLLDQVIESAPRSANKVKISPEMRELKPGKSMLTDKDKQKLVLAKAKLQNMLMIASQIKSRDNLQ